MTTNDRKKYCSQILRQILQKPLFFCPRSGEVSAGFCCSISCSIFTPVSQNPGIVPGPGPAPPHSSCPLLTFLFSAKTMATNSYAAVAAAGTVLLSLQHTLRAILANYIVPTTVMPSIRRREVNRYHARRRVRVERTTQNATINR